MPRHLTRIHYKILRTAIVLLYDLACLTLALLCASLLHAPQGLSFFAELFTSSDVWFLAMNAALVVLLGVLFRLFGISLSSFGFSDVLRLVAGASAILRERHACRLALHHTVYRPFLAPCKRWACLPPPSAQPAPHGHGSHCPR